jgi:hypothetical protein
MAVLSASDRAAVSAQFQTDSSRLRDQFGALSKADLQAAINAADDWADANKASYNAALPLPARTALTAAQKAAILLYVIRRRYEVGA